MHQYNPISPVHLWRSSVLTLVKVCSWSLVMTCVIEKCKNRCVFWQRWYFIHWVCVWMEQKNSVSEFIHCKFASNDAAFGGAVHMEVGRTNYWSGNISREVTKWFLEIFSVLQLNKTCTLALCDYFQNLETYFYCSKLVLKLGMRSTSDRHHCLLSRQDK